ncbi:IRA2 [Candida theae]|uniref:IRA2 n=1 Tax=Candida theae TaxID=1198502 RepID=A0AAD5BHP2_9ASCO|nr:IRA2 [Candida theae]KAI5964022.1 IRA2 [Candida theae]
MNKVSKDENDRRFIDAVVKRIESLLPFRTGHSVQEVEIDAQFITSKRILLDFHCKNGHMISLIVTSFTSLLQTINTEAQNARLKYRDEKSRSSTLLVCKTLAEILKANWDRETTFLDDKDILSNYSRFYYYEPPQPLDPSIVPEALSFYINLMSTGVVRKVLSMVRNEKTMTNIAVAKEEQDIAREDQPMTHSEKVFSAISEIDSYIEVVLRFISTANPDDYYKYIQTRLYAYSDNNQTIPLPTIQKYCPVMKYAFYSEMNALTFAEESLKTISFIKSNTWKQVYLFFLATSIKDQSLSRVGDYYALVDPNNLRHATALKQLFDSAMSVFEDNYTLVSCAPYILTCFSTLCVSDFAEMNSIKPLNKLKLAFNKRLRFLSTILKDASNSSNLESFDALINIFHLGARLETSNFRKHPVLMFSLRHLDEVFHQLIRYEEVHRDKLVTDEELATKRDYLLVNYYIAAVILRPEKYAKIIIERYRQSEADMRVNKLFVKLVKGLAEIEIAKDIFHSFVLQFRTTLKSIMYGSLKILRGYGEQNINESSDYSSYSSDALSIDENEIKANQATDYAFGQNKSSIDHYAEALFDKSQPSKDDRFKSSTAISLASSNSYNFRIVNGAEEIVSDIFLIFAAAPELYFNDEKLMDDSNLESTPYSQLLSSVVEFCHNAIVPIRLAFKANWIVDGNSRLFDSARTLSMQMVTLGNKIETERTSLSTFANFTICNCIVQSICETCLGLTLSNPKFKSSFLFLINFLHQRDKYSDFVRSNAIILDHKSRELYQTCGKIIHSVEKVLLLSLCTHDVQFYNYTKQGIKWYINEIHNNKVLYRASEIEDNQLELFEKLSNDDGVFTGFVSLQKRHRKILRDAKPTKSLYHVWLIIFSRWNRVLRTNDQINENNLIFRHFTGFLVSTSGCFMSANTTGSGTDEIHQRSSAHISDFFDKCIDLLNSSDLVVRVIIKDTLSNESHSDVYHLIATKLMARASAYAEEKFHTEESVIFLEEAMIIMSAMINVHNDGALLLSSLLPHICQFFITFIDNVVDITDKFRLKLRFCKLAQALELDKTNSGLHGAYKLRNFYAKSMLEWLEQIMIMDEDVVDNSLSESKTSELIYLKMDFAIHCAKSLSLQLEELLLEIPDGVKDSEVKKYKDIAFGNYFSIFYKIIQKYTKTSSSDRFKHKLQQVTDYVLASITNLLQYDSDIGIQYLLPMGYHEDKKIRAIFLNVFASMLTSKTVKKGDEEYPYQLVEQLVEETEIFGSIAECASSSEHNLLASSLFGVFSYTNKLDKLFTVLLTDEVANLTRSTDLFRRNSTLTRLLFNFTQDHGLEYLKRELFAVIEEIVKEDVYFEVEKRESSEDSALFITYLGRLVDSIVGSFDALPNAFKFVCSQIYQSVSSKFEDSALIAVGSFIFLRFICPAIVSPQQYFKIPVENSKTKRSLMQLVKVLQNMANGTISTIKWPGLVDVGEILNGFNLRIREFLTRISTVELMEYPFLPNADTKPIAEIRYLHKFIYVYFAPIRMNFLLGKSAFSVKTLHERVKKFKSFDLVVMKLGQPKANVRLQLASNFRIFDPSSGDGEELKFNDFMTKSSLKYADTPPDALNLIQSSIFKDGTPVVVVNLRRLKFRPDDINYLVYKLLETASQIWENKFYLIYDFSEFYFFKSEAPDEYTHLVSSYAPKQFFASCSRVYYFNVPRTEYTSLIKSMQSLRKKGSDFGTKIYIHSSIDPDSIVSNLCLDAETVSISRDAKVTYRNVMLYEPSIERYEQVSLRIGRKFLTVCFKESVQFKSAYSAMDNFTPLEVHRLTDLVRCEVSDFTGVEDEFTIYFKHNEPVTFRSPNRLEILRFLYFTTSRLPRDTSLLDAEKDSRAEAHVMHWFGRLYNIVFQGLLSNDAGVKSSAAVLFGSLSSYFGIDFGINEAHAKYLPFPTDATAMVVSVSKHLSIKFPEMTYRFFKAYFDNFEKMDLETRMSSVLYVAPWINNIYDYVYSQSGFRGPDRVAELIRQFCRLTMINKNRIPFTNDYIWRILFRETRLVSSLVDEVVAFAIDSKNEGPEWSFIIAVITPSVEVCGEVMSRLQTAIKYVLTTDSAIASQSKLFEITVLIKICSSLFFSSYALARLYLADVIFLVTLFIDNAYLEVGADLRNLIISTVQSFLHKPNLTSHQQDVINNTIEYFTTPRAKMLFGMTREAKPLADIGQAFNRIINFEVLCDYLNEFIEVVSTSDDKTNWKARWSSNAIDVAFNNFSLFQDNAILVVGILAKRGITDSVACRTIKLVAHGELRRIDTVICVAVSAARIIEGLPSDSMLPPILIWSQLCFALLNQSILYQSATENLVASMVKIMGHDDYIANAYTQRQFLEPHLSEFEEKHGICITENNFRVYIFQIFTRGLKISQYRNSSLKCIKSYVKKRYELSREKPIPDDPLWGNAHAYLVMLYLFSDTKEFEEFLDELDYVYESFNLKNGQRIPIFLLEFLETNQEASKLTLLQLGGFFADEKIIDVGFRMKFISIYHYLLNHNQESALLIFHLVESALARDLAVANSLEAVESISGIIFQVSEIEDYRPESYIASIDDIIRSRSLVFLNKMDDLQPVEAILDEESVFKQEFDKDIKAIQFMFYRAACTYIEGLKLED